MEGLNLGGGEEDEVEQEGMDAYMLKVMSEIGFMWLNILILRYLSTTQRR